MNLKTKAAVLKSNIRFKIELEKQKLFFDQPATLKLLKSNAVTLLMGFLLEQKLKIQDKFDVNNDPTAKAIVDFTGKQTDDSIASDLLLMCMNGELPKLPSEITPDSILAYTTAVNDIDDKASKSLINKILNINPELALLSITGVIMLYHIAMHAKDLITETEHPSHYRTKYIQKLIRNTYSVLQNNLNSYSKKEVTAENGSSKDIKGSRKDEFANIKVGIKNILKSLKLIDAALIAIGLATALYTSNRGNVQAKSSAMLNEASLDLTCESVTPAFDVSVNIIPLPTDFSCASDIDDDLVPHEPIESKIENFACPIDVSAEIPADPTASTDWVTHAILRNTTDRKLNIAVNVSTNLLENQFFGSIGEAQFYSPITGVVQKISEKEIVLKDIQAIDQNYIETQLNALNEKYTRLNSVKYFLKDYSTEIYYPILLTSSLTQQQILPNILSSISKNFVTLKKRVSDLKDDYEKSIKRIAGKDNVEKHANNETLTEIKDAIEQADENFLKTLNLIQIEISRDSGFIKADISEMQIAPYYVTLIDIFNKIENPSSVEMEALSMLKSFLNNRRTLGSSYNAIKREIVTEGNALSAFIDKLQKEVNTIAIDVIEIQKKIDNASKFATYSIIEFEDKQARLYAITQDVSCKSLETNDYINPHTSKGFGDISYWMRYCAFATLASVANPATGWSTGWITPPTTFPVVYIPIKSIETKYGFIVIGLTICGIFLFPFTLFVNYTSNASIPIGNPFAGVLNKINAAKKELSDEIVKLKTSTVKPILKSIKVDIDAKKIEANQMKQNIIDLKGV